MSLRQEIERAIALYIEAINTDNVSIIPFAEEVILCGPMLPEPVHGESAVRQYVGETAPFIACMKLNTTVIEENAAALFVEFEGLNGAVIEGAILFRFEGGLICYCQFFFDTRLLFKGAQ
jgi:hypothetical protein